RQGAERLGWELDRLLDSTLQAMRACEDDIAAQMASL
ncbi:MAG TPA: hydrolase, partial [Ruthenibacterium lactatiformans]|nr:hydrolase [Ruthenibacterium lactatiformans]